MAFLTADGCVDSIPTLTSTDCCPQRICEISMCSLMCNFIGLLPNGPLWDRKKQEGMQKWVGRCNGLACNDCTDADCGSMVDFAAFCGARLWSLIQEALWPSLREANPYTAVTTIDSWLDRLGWADCWASACRDRRLGPSPYEQNVPCGVIVDVPKPPPELDMAVKRGIVLALWRLRMEPIKNLCGINWVIEPLSASLRPIMLDAPLTGCKGAVFELCQTGTIPGLPGRNCDEPPVAIPASYVYDGRTIWPATLAAHCIALSMMPFNPDCTAPLPIVRC